MKEIQLKSFADKTKLNASRMYKEQKAKEQKAAKDKELATKESLLAKREFAAKQRKDAADKAHMKRVNSAKLAIVHNTAKPHAFKSAKNKLLEKEIKEPVEEEDFEESVQETQ